jgi:hypothetical protein
MKMTPTFLLEDASDDIRVNTIFPGKGGFGASKSYICIENLQNVLVCKFGVGLPCATKLPTFRDFIQYVICLRAEKKVVRSNASGIIALMAGKLAFGDRTVGKFVGKPMSEASLTPGIAKPAITSAVNSPSPKPASFGLDDVAPKPFFNRSGFGFSLVLTGTKPTAKPAITASNVRGKSGEFFTAILANLKGSCGIMGVHGNLPFRVAPLAGTNCVGAFCC